MNKTKGVSGRVATPQFVASSDSVRIQYQTYGKGDVAIVLVHGWSCNASYWNAQLDALSSQYTVVTLDLAGYGGSGKNRTDWTIARYGDDIAAVVRALPNRKIILVGHSMGGGAILEAALRPLAGQQLLGLIGADTFKSIGQPAPPPAAINAIIESYKNDFKGALYKTLSETMFPKNTDPQWVRKIADDMGRTPPEIAIPMLQQMFNDSADSINKISLPIIAINSDVSPTDETRIRKVLPNFHLVIVPDTSHFMMMQEPERFNLILLQKIQTLLMSGSTASNPADIADR